MWFIIASSLLLLASILPLINCTHWFFRVFQYGKIQIVSLQLVLLATSFILVSEVTMLVITLQFFTLMFIISHLITLYKFTPFYNKVQKRVFERSSEKITTISANIYKENKDYDRFIKLIQKYDPTIFLTLESDSKWDDALKIFDKDYPFHIKVPLENTYGMHLFSKIEITAHKVHYFIADDLPSIEAKMQTKDGYKFTFFGVHPPPPSPTEEKNSKERDGELLSVAKRIKKNADSCIVFGDFNNVAWAKSSILFRKTSEMLDGRMGRGFISTYHAKYFFLRFPIDLIFHTSDIFIDELKKLDYFGSDHFPIYSKFSINKEKSIQDEDLEKLEKEDEKNVNSLIKEGKKEKSENRN